VPHANGDFSEEDLIAQDNVLISFSAGAYIKRTAADAFRAQGRGGKGVKGMATKGEDEVIDLRFARTLDHILFFTNKGRVYSSRVYDLPEGSRTSKGVHIANVLTLQYNEEVTTMLTLEEFVDANTSRSSRARPASNGWRRPPLPTCARTVSSP
jgi:DNA gyrase subunit A